MRQQRGRGRRRPGCRGRGRDIGRRRRRRGGCRCGRGRRRRSRRGRRCGRGSGRRSQRGDRCRRPGLFGARRRRDLRQSGARQGHGDPCNRQPCRNGTPHSHQGPAAQPRLVFANHCSHSSVERELAAGWLPGGQERAGLRIAQAPKGVVIRRGCGRRRRNRDTAGGPRPVIGIRRAGDATIAIMPPLRRRVRAVRSAYLIARWHGAGSGP